MNTTQPKTFFFSPENEAKAKKIVAQYPPRRQASAMVPLLDLAQRQHGGWLPGAAIVYVAQMLGVPEVKAFEVASFYTMFNVHPVGTYLVQLCRTTPCWLAGSEEIAKACEAHLGIKIGETTPDGMFTLKEVECLGACVNAPVMQVNDDYYEELTPEKVVAILRELAAGGKPKNGAKKKGGKGGCGGACLCGKGEG